MIQDLLEVWRTHDEINVYLLEQISDQGFEAATLLKNGHYSKGRTVARVFKHMHEVCAARMWVVNSSPSCRTKFGSG